MTYDLIDAVAMNREFPDTFHRPDDEDIASIVPSTFVKIGVTFDHIHGCSDERFWVRVDGVNGSSITGFVTNNLVFSEVHGLDCDDIVEFSTNHVLMVADGE